MTHKIFDWTTFSVILGGAVGLVLFAALVGLLVEWVGERIGDTAATIVILSVFLLVFATVAGFIQ